MHNNSAILSGLSLQGLYAITDSALMPGELLFSKTEAVLRGGCRIIQYRNKKASGAELKREAQVLRDLCRRYHALFMVNDHLALAQEIDADGIHIGQSDLSLVELRRQVGDKMIIGVSCHSDIQLALQAEQQGASYVAFGRFFESQTKPNAPQAKLDILHRAKQQLRIPIVAIGGITRDNAPRVIAQGSGMIAVIHDLFSPNDVHEIEQRARTFTQLFSG